MPEENKTAAFAWFLSDDGKKALDWLKADVFRSCDPKTTKNKDIWFTEGQRALIERIEYMAKRSLKNGTGK